MTAGFAYPDQLEIQPHSGRPLSATVSVPGSKSITNRALVLAALSPHCLLTGALQSEDTEVMLDCLSRMGWEIETDWDRERITVRRTENAPREADLFVGNSGTTIRFLCAMLSLGGGPYRLDGVPRMRERPIGDLLDALVQLGVDARAENGNGCPPVLIQSSGLKGGTVRVRADKSSQFLSGLLLALPFGAGDTIVEIEGVAVSEPYIEMTLRMLRSAGIRVEVLDGSNGYRVPGRQNFPGGSIAVEPDASSASYFFAAAAILGGRVTVQNLSLDSLQGDVHFVRALENMGCRVETCDAGITVHGGKLMGIDIDMNAISDTVMTLGAVACFAEGPTTIRNVAHIRHKETDRIAALATELRRLGAEVEEFEEGLRITPQPLHGATVETYSDHRMAMSLALVGLRVPGIVIQNPGCVAKTYPGFWLDLANLLEEKA